MLKKLIKILKDKDFILDNKLIDQFDNSSIVKDSIYEISQLIFESSKINHSTRIKCHEELIKISKQKKCNFSIAHNLNLSSRVYSVLGQNNKAIPNDLEALKIWKNLKNDPLAINGQINSYANLGNVYLDLGLYKKSLDYFHKGLKALKKCKNDLIPYIRIHLGLGNVHSHIKRYKKAETFFIKAYNEAKKTKNDLIIIPCEVALIRTKMNYYDYNAVIAQCKKIIKRLDKINDVIEVWISKEYLFLSDYIRFLLFWNLIIPISSHGTKFLIGLNEKLNFLLYYNLISNGLRAIAMLLFIRQYGLNAIIFAYLTLYFTAPIMFKIVCDTVNCRMHKIYLSILFILSLSIMVFSILSKVNSSHNFFGIQMIIFIFLSFLSIYYIAIKLKFSKSIASFKSLF